ncbi:MAG: peptidase S8, partial [Pseudoalteromonas sp.]|nr:peptidase S8 [Pseudoalteromonas sp.]
MTTSKSFKRCAIALTISTVFAASASVAQDVSTSMAETTAKLQSQSGFETQFIIKYKNSANDMLSISSADASPANMKKRAQRFVKNFASKKGKVKAKYIRAMALNNHHVMRADKKLSAAEAQGFMQEMIDSGNVEYIEVDQMLKPFATPNDPRYGDQWHYYEQAGGLNLPTAWDTATGSGVVVAVLDTGYRPHVDLNANILPGYDMISNLSVANDGGGRDSDARDPGDAVAAGECGNNGAQGSSWHG